MAAPTRKLDPTLLPNLRPTAHSVNVLEKTDGTVMLTWFAGTYEGCEDQIGVVTEKKPGEDTWPVPRVMTRAFEYEGDRWVTEQVLPIENADGEIVVYTWAAPFSEYRLLGRNVEDNVYRPTLESNATETTWRRNINTNRPFRFTWRDGQMQDLECVSGQGGMHTHGVVFQGKPFLRDPQAGPAGGWVIPYHDQRNQTEMAGRFLLTGGDGRTLEDNDANIAAAPGCLEPALAPMGGDRWLCYLRYCRHNEGFIWRAESNDGCRTFTEPILTNLRNPHAGIDIHPVGDGRLVVIYNDSQRLRTPLTLAISDDDGATWRAQDIEMGPGEYSYPKVTRFADGTWHAFYTWRRLTIAHVPFELAWLEEGRKVVGL